jgi:hypothetical protein
MSARQQALMSVNHAGFRLLEWRALANSSTALAGHVTAEMPSGMIIPDIPAFRRADGSLSVGVPSKPLVDGEGRQLRDDAGKRRYAPVISFASPAVKTRWCTAIADLLEAEEIGAGR